VIARMDSAHEYPGVSVQEVEVNSIAVRSRGVSNWPLQFRRAPEHDAADIHKATGQHGSPSKNRERGGDV